jgi:hypothetical protein
MLNSQSLICYVYKGRLEHGKVAGFAAVLALDHRVIVNLLKKQAEADY